MLHLLTKLFRAAFGWLIPNRGVAKEEAQDKWNGTPFLLQRDGTFVSCSSCGKTQLPYPSILLPIKPVAFRMKENPSLVKFKWSYKDYCLPCAKLAVKSLKEEHISVGTKQ